MRIATAVLTAIGALLAALSLAVAPAQANSTRVAISDFQWSNKNPQVDLGESVTWDWIGPDTEHSVSGQPNNATQWDSDPGSVQPHPLGDTFSVTFDQPGEYLFVCKLHSSVRGTVTVSDKPGDPNSDPGPQAPLNLDHDIPDFQSVQLGGTQLGPRGNGVLMTFAINERGTISADYYKLIKKRVRNSKKKKTVRSFAGYGEWTSHIGNNQLRFASRTPNFAAKPGKYVALVTATDESVNTTPSVPLKFQINKTTKKKRK